MTEESDAQARGPAGPCRGEDLAAGEPSGDVLLGSLDELAAVYASVPVGLLLVDPARNVQKVNAAAARLAGRAERDMVGLAPGASLRCLHHLDDPRGCGAGPACAVCPVRLAVLDTLATGTSHEQVEAYFPTRGDAGTREVWLSVSTAPVILHGRRYALVWAQDVTARKQAEAEWVAHGSLLEALIESTEDPIFSVDCQYRYTAFNSSHAKVMKALFNRDIAVGASILDYHINPEDRAIAQGNLDRALRGESVRVEYYCGDDAFQRRHFTIVHTPIRGEDGAVKGVAVFASDMTVYKQAEEAARSSAQTLRSMINAITESAFLMKLDGTVLMSNTTTASRLGLQVEKLVGRNIFDVLPENVVPRRREAVATVAASGRPLQFEDIRLGRDIVNSIYPVTDSAGRVAHLVVFGYDVTELKRADEAIRRSEVRYRTLVENVSLGISLIGADHRIQAANAAQARLSRRSTLELIGQECFRVFRGRLEVCPDCPGVTAMVSGVPAEVEHEAVRSDGSLFTVRVQAFPLAGPDGVSQGFIEVVEDVTRHRQLEAQFHQAQKLQAVGQLAGGVAHDFRNQLQVILGFGEMLLRRSLVKEEGRNMLYEVLKAAERSTAITGQLLAFSRQETLRPSLQSLKTLVADMGKVLSHMIGEDIRLLVQLSPDESMVNIDSHLFQQAILNLATNARDAMPGGGTLTIQTACVTLGAESRRIDPEMAEGRYVVVTVADTGSGMDEATLAKAFDPFFTTKRPGRGTGLGLPMVCGFVKQSGGAIDLQSEPGRGTTVRLYFPRVGSAVAGGPPPRGDGPAPESGETVLVVEDEPAVRAVTAEVLRQAGYRVLEAGGAAQALALAEQHAGAVDVLATDVIMPGGSGPALARQLEARYPGIAVMYVSGYPGQELSSRGIGESVETLNKPFTSESLLGKVRQVLDARRAGRASGQP